MPELSRFFGIIIAMFYDGHAPPHFHVRCGRQRAIVAIETLALIEGTLSPRVRGLVTEWAALHQSELREAVAGGAATRAARADRAIGVKAMDEVVEVRHLGGHRLFLRFADGAEGEVDLGSRLRFDGVFAPLRDPAAFGRVRLDPELGTVVWPSGADLCPDVLRGMLEQGRAAAE